MRRARGLALVFAAIAATGTLAQPAGKPIRFVTPIPPGGGPDLVARMLAAKLAEPLGQSIIVENRAGSNGNIAAEAVLKSPADGTTFLVGMDSLVAINPHLYRKMSFDPLHDLAPIASLVANGFVLSVHPSLPVKTLAEFIDHSKQAKPPLQYASGGNGSQHHLTMERLKARAGIELVHVPYKGGAPATTATVAGDVAAMMSGTSTAAQIKAGRLRAIAVTSARRSSVLPEVPTIAETYADFTMTQWYGLFAPVGVADAIVDRIRGELNRILDSNDTREKLRGIGGVEPWITTRTEFAAAIRSDHARYGRLVREIGITID